MERKIDKILYSIDRCCTLLDVAYLKLYLKQYSHDQIFQIIYEADNLQVVKYAPLEPEEKIKCYINICNRLGIVYDPYIDKVLKPLCNQKNEIVLNCLKYYYNNYNRVNMLLRIKDEYQRVLGTTTFTVKNLAENYQQVIASVKRKDVLLKAYNEGNLDEIAKCCILLVSDDCFKREHLDEVAISWQVDIILSLKDESCKKEYAVLEKYAEYRAKLINDITDEKFVIEYFKKNELLKFRLELIMMMENEKLKKKLVELLKPSVVKEVIKSNEIAKKNFLVNGSEVILEENFDKNITFGVELECCGAEWRDFLLIQRILRNWEIKEERSVLEGIEITSPVLKFDTKSLQELQYICQLLNRGEFYTDQRCGGHLHFGFDYFETPQEVKMFLELYCAVEDILIIISNKKGSVSREGMMKYAKKFTPAVQEQMNLVDLATSIKRLKDYARILKSIPKTRYYALNLLNIGEKYKNTIEFRMPNGEIDFNELLLNVQLFAKLMEKSKKLTWILSGKCKESNQLDELKKYRMLLDDDIVIELKVELLLELLFSSQAMRNKYLERYHVNKPNNNGLLIRKYVENDTLEGRF